MVDRIDQFQRRVIGREARNLFAEIDIVAAFVQKRQPLHDRGNFGHGAGDRTGEQEPLEVEHALAGQFGPAVLHKLGSGRAAGPVQRIRIKIQNIAHYKSPIAWGRLSARWAIGKAAC